MRQNIEQREVRIGERIKTRRRVLGMSVSELAKLVAVSPQQILKYENGTNRVSASRLFCIANVLCVTLDYFKETTGRDESTTGFAPLDRETVEAIKLLAEIPPEHKGAVLKLLRSLTTSRKQKPKSIAA